MAGISESALRGYELGARYPKEKHLDALARALRVRPEAFNSYGIVTGLEFIHALFNCESSFRLEPDERGYAYVTSQDRTIWQALQDWGLMRSQLRDGAITESEYEDWKASYNPSVLLGDGLEEVPDPYTGKLGSENRPNKG